jgi:hypothetical protein
MFGIDLGITLGSVSLVSGDGKKVLRFFVLKGNPKVKDDFKRCVDMADGIVGAINTLTKLSRRTTIEPLVSVEEPVFVPWTRNPRSFFNLSCLYALVRAKLQVRGYFVISVNPKSAKATAQRIFGTKRLKTKYLSSANTKRRTSALNKKGMVLAYKRIHGQEPVYSNQLGRETLADSYFIALTGIDRIKTGMVKWKTPTEY